MPRNMRTAQRSQRGRQSNTSNVVSSKKRAPNARSDSVSQRQLSVFQTVIDDSPDAAIARTLFDGIVETNKRGLPHHRYLRTDEERKAKLALVRLLVSGKSLDNGVRLHLAEHFHPGTQTDRMLVLVPRSTRRKKQSDRGKIDL